MKPAILYCTGTSDWEEDFTAESLWLTPSGQTPAQEHVRIGTYADGTYNYDFVGQAPVVDMTHHHVGPAIGSYEETITWDEVTAGSGENAFNQWRATSDRDSILQAMLTGLPLWQSYDQGYLALASNWEALAVPTCGTTQRFTFWNQSCSQVMQQEQVTVVNGIVPVIGLAPEGGANPEDPMDGTKVPATGQWYLTHTGPSIVVRAAVPAEIPGDPQPRCSMQEPRQLSPTCPGGATCSASGSCVFSRWDGSAVAPAPLPTWTLLE